MFSFAALFCIVLLSPSCKKDKDAPTPEPTPVPEYAALKVGNYWVYETYFTDAQGATTVTEYYDSTFIEKDTLINGKTYYKKVVQSLMMPSTSFWREENGVLVDQLGKPLPTEAGVIGSKFVINGNDTLLETISTLLPDETTVNVPAGIFKVRTIEHTNKIFEPGPNGKTTRIKKSHTQYHTTKGEITHSYFYAFPRDDSHFELVLARTNVK